MKQTGKYVAPTVISQNLSVKFAAGIYFMLITLMLEKKKQGKTNKVIVLQESIPSSID